MQYKIPQNVDVEDKIFGPFSLRQFTWMVVGGFLTFVLYLLLAGTSFFLFFIAALPVVLVFGALAFLKINERPLSSSSSRPTAACSAPATASGSGSLFPRPRSSPKNPSLPRWLPSPASMRSARGSRSSP
jgi:hypothetical protein